MCWKVEGVIWKERDGDGRTDLNGTKKFFPVREFWVYRGRCWQHRKNKDPNTLYRL